MKRRLALVLVVAMIQWVLAQASFAGARAPYFSNSTVASANPTPITPASTMTIHDAVKTGNLEVVTRLIAEDPANLEAPDRNGKTPLHLAIIRGRTEPVQTLLAAGADVNALDKNGFTPLHWAAVNSGTANVQALIAFGADVEARDEDGWTPLQRVQSVYVDTGAALQPQAIAQLHTQTALSHTTSGNHALAARSHTWAAKALPGTEEARTSYTSAAESFIAAGDHGAAAASYALAGNLARAAESHTQKAHAQAAAGDYTSAVEHYRLSHAAHTRVGNHDSAQLSQVMVNCYAPIVDGQRHAQTMESHFRSAVAKVGEMQEHRKNGDEDATAFTEAQLQESLSAADLSEANAISAFEAALVALDGALEGAKRVGEEARVANAPTEHLAQDAATVDSLRAHMGNVSSKIDETRASAAAGHTSVSAARGI